MSNKNSPILTVAIETILHHIGDKGCYPNHLLIESETNELGMAALAMQDKTEVYIGLKMGIAECLNAMKSCRAMVFYFDQEATPKQQREWKLTKRDFVSIVHWTKDKTSYGIIEYERGNTKQDLEICYTNKILNTQFKKDLELLEVFTALKEIST